MPVTANQINLTDIGLKFGVLVAEGHALHILQILTDCSRHLFKILASKTASNMQWIKGCYFILKAVANTVDNVANKTINVFVPKVTLVPFLQSSLQVFLEKEMLISRDFLVKNKNKLPHSVHAELAVYPTVL